MFYITLTNGTKVKAVYRATESQLVGGKFGFKKLTNGKTVKAVSFVDQNGNLI